MINISKSRFLSGNQCEKKLYFDVNAKHLKPSVSDDQQAIFDKGHQIGGLARLVYPNGKSADENINGDWSIAIQRTKDWLNENVETIYEATFAVDGVFAALDILHHVNGERWAIEVKSSTHVKDYHLIDASFQYFVMKKAGYAPDKIFIMHVNNKYVKDGTIILDKFFYLENITDKVLIRQHYIEGKHAMLSDMLKMGLEPIIDIGKHCSIPFNCEYMNHCWGHLPPDHVFSLNNPRGKDWNLYEQGIYSLSDIPDDFPLNHRQTLQVNGVKNNNEYFNLEEIKNFLNVIQGPIYFFDFETINPMIPILNGTRPFEQIPFQYSLHVTDILGNITDHKEFIAKPEDFNNVTVTDPRLQLIQQLKNDIKSEGTIIAYNASFEISRLKELAIAFPNEKLFLDNLIARFVDLLVPFNKGWFYKPEMGASASIKSVLPAIAPKFSYSDLEIGNGGLASEIYLSMIENRFKGDKATIIKNLFAYCERDTEGMVVIYRHLINCIA